ncbi:MAG: hypothetical protein V8Q42_03965 [Anaerovoracaceae bacterium]
MAGTMQLLLPVMVPLLISMGGISSGGILDPVIISAVTGFSFFHAACLSCLWYSCLLYSS